VPMAAMITRLLTAAILAILAFDAGSFSLTSRTTLAVVVWWTLGLTIVTGLLPRERPDRLSLAVGGLLFLFAAFTALSAAWAPSAEKALTEANRAFLYAGAFALVLGVATRRNAMHLGDGVGIGIGVVGIAALASRLFPELAGSHDLAFFLPEARTRLSYPLEYWNGLAILVAIGLPLLLRIAVAGGVRWWRLGALATIPALATTIFLTSSRGGVLVALVGLATFLALTEDRRRAAFAIASSGTGSAAAIAVLFAHPVLIDGPFETPSAESDGRVAAMLIVGCCAATVLLAIALEQLPRRPPRVLSLGAAVVAAAVVIAVVATSDPFERIAQASGGSDDWGSVRSHLLNVSDSKRRQLWASAFDQFTDHPLVGDGAGSFEAWWSEHRNVSTFVRDAHSLYLETLGELGLVGFSLLAAATVLALLIGFRRVRESRGHERIFTAALAASLVGFALAATEDWMWEMTVVSLVGISLLAVFARASTPRPSTKEPVAMQLWARGLVSAVCVAIVFVEGVALLSSTSLEESKRAAARGDIAYALETADRARALQPWAASPYLQRALVLEETGNLSEARIDIARALSKDERDWRLWLVAARIETARGNISEGRSALAQVRRLNPLLPLFSES
jgi:O-Antigen ligase